MTATDTSVPQNVYKSMFMVGFLGFLGSVAWMCFSPRTMLSAGKYGLRYLFKEELASTTETAIKTAWETVVRHGMAGLRDVLIAIFRGIFEWISMRFSKSGVTKTENTEESLTADKPSAQQQQQRSSPPPGLRQRRHRSWENESDAYESDDDETQHAGIFDTFKNALFTRTAFYVYIGFMIISFGILTWGEYDQRTRDIDNKERDIEECTGDCDRLEIDRLQLLQVGPVPYAMAKAYRDFDLVGGIFPIGSVLFSIASYLLSPILRTLFYIVDNEAVLFFTFAVAPFCLVVASVFAVMRVKPDWFMQPPQAPSSPPVVKKTKKAF